MATPNDVAQALGIDPSKVTARGLLEHAFPGVVRCIPAGPSRDAFVDGLGGSLLRAALDDDAGDPFRYNGQLQMIRHVLEQPEMQQILAKCQQQGETPGTTPGATPGNTPGATPGTTSAPTGVQGGDPGGGPGPIGIGTVLAALGLTAAVGTMLWWVTRRRPGESSASLPSRSNPDGPPRIDAATIEGYEWTVGTLYLQTEPILFLQPKGAPGTPRDRAKRWAEVFPDSRTRPTVLIYKETAEGGEKVVSEHVVDAGWREEKLRAFARSLGPRFSEMGYAMWFAERILAKQRGVVSIGPDEKRKRKADLEERSNPRREYKVGHDVSVRVGKEWQLVGNEEDHGRATRWALKLAADRKTSARVKSDYGVIFTAQKDGSYQGKLDPEPDYGDGQGL